MFEIEKILLRHLNSRGMQKQPDRAIQHIQQCALDIIRASVNVKLTSFACAEILGACESWVRRHVPLKGAKGRVPLATLRAFMACVKAYSLGGNQADYLHEYDLQTVQDIVIQAFIAAGSEGADPTSVFTHYAPRLVVASGDRFLTKDQVVQEFRCPSRYLSKR